ncbi:MAG TPA: mevalonate kinase [Candidatus Bilamarchaeum sp.]|nr:mevalonate kinase [Candidatus Bilamarchaeum sp.]
MGKGIGKGKIIIFGEHFVVHGAAAIAGGISNSAIVTVKKAPRNRILTSQKVVEELSLAGIGAVLKSMDIRDAFDVSLEGDLPTYGGLGSSAAFCVGLVRALCDERGMHLTNDQVNRHAYAGEMAFHGNPSGIDNTMATHGGVIEFKRGKTLAESKFDFIDLKKPLDMVVSFTGKYSPTPKMVESVSRFRQEDEAEFAQLMDEYLSIAMNGRKAIEKGQGDVIGQLMNENQSLLAELGVSDERNDMIHKIAMKEGALGAKVTGGGGGGCSIALCADEAHAKALAKKLTKDGFDSFATQVKKG